MTTYGTTTNGSSVANGATRGDEEQPLLRSKPVPRSLVSRLRKQMTAEVSRSWADIVLLLCYVVTGLLDSASTQVWGAFVSMQTGWSRQSTERESCRVPHPTFTQEEVDHKTRICELTTIPLRKHRLCWIGHRISHLPSY